MLLLYIKIDIVFKHNNRPRPIHPRTSFRLRWTINNASVLYSPPLVALAVSPQKFALIHVYLVLPELHCSTVPPLGFQWYYHVWY